MLHLFSSSPERKAIRYVKVLAWTLISLVTLDFAAASIFGMPRDPRVPPQRVQGYINYGRSIEGKLRAMVGPDDSLSAPIVVAGWIDKECHPAATEPPGTLGVSVFGNSFSNQLRDALNGLDHSLSIVAYGGPGSPPNHSYACFIKEQENGDDRHPVQILGITTSTLPRMEAIWGATTSFELPQPFTFPRYRLGPDGELTVHEPSVRSPGDLHLILSDRARWNAWLAELKAEDEFYVRGLTVVDAGDRSVLGRMIRRSFGQYILRNRTNELRGSDGKFVAPDIVNVLPKLVSNFAKRVRATGARPIIVLFEEYGYGGVLMPILSATLANEHIDYVTSANVAPANDLRNYAADGHFSGEANKRIAEAVLKLIHTPGTQVHIGVSTD